MSEKRNKQSDKYYVAAIPTRDSLHHIKTLGSNYENLFLVEAEDVFEACILHPEAEDYINDETVLEIEELESKDVLLSLLRDHYFSTFTGGGVLIIQGTAAIIAYSADDVENLQNKETIL